MKTDYRDDLKAHLSLDEKRKVRHIRHSQEYWQGEQNVPRLVATEYLNQMSGALQIPPDQLKNLDRKVSFFDPRDDRGVEYQQNEEKRLFDSTIVGYYQTYKNVPVWRKGLAVKIKENPSRVAGATNNSEDDIYGKLPDPAIIERYKTLFRRIAASSALAAAGLEQPQEEADIRTFLGEVLKREIPAASPRFKSDQTLVQDNALMSGKFFFYKYDPEKRYEGKPSPPGPARGKTEVEEAGDIPIPELPPVADSIRSGQSYLVAEIILRSTAQGFGGLVWLILVELETNSILYIECMTCGVNGLVFRLDPIVKTGDLNVTSDDSNAALIAYRDAVLLTNLDAPVAGTQHLRGSYVDIEKLPDADADPDIDPPTKLSGVNFDYDVRTNDFGAVCAYYHQTQLFRTIESLGFPISTYFDGTTFPIPVDHRSLGTAINAHWSPNGTGGTGHMCYGLVDTTNTIEPLCRSVDPWVHWHEMGGHGVLGDHVGSGNLGFAHSHGDGLAALQMDPESKLRELNKPERFEYAPFNPILTRRFDRDPVTWAWGSGNDDGGYGSEEILATCHFRIYRSIGGDHSNLGRRQFASRVVTYLILRTTAGLTPATNPNDAEIWCEEMQDTDLENWTSEGISGGAYNKVIRWAFEKQGNYSAAPPPVDVYIDDGRAGEYQFQAVHWHNTSMWNRNSPDGLPGHQNAVDGATNYMYGKVKNRGASTATNVTVRAYHSLPGAGLTWPGDFTEMSPIGGINIAPIGPNNTEEVTVGPFEWSPNVNVYGHDCVLMIASVAGDPSNIDNFTGTETIAEWRLVPNDNNVGQRNVNIVPGGGGNEALLSALNGAVFFASNSFNRPASMELQVEMPAVLSSRGWRLEFPDIVDNKFRLKAGEKRRIALKLNPGTAFTPDDVRRAGTQDINVYLYGNGILLGGMTYQVDPDLKEPSGGGRKPAIGCNDAAQKLLDCLKVSGMQKVKKVCVKKVSLDIRLSDDCDCD